MNITYAIDFGTSNSLLAASVDGEAQPPLRLDPSCKDAEILRSLMYFPRGRGPSFGQKAIEDYTEEMGDGRFIRSIKKHLPSEVFRGTQIHNQFYKLEDLIAIFLREMKTRADQHFQRDVDRVVLGRPAKFSMDSDKDRLAQNRLEEAARKAGFRHIDFFPEPLAAAMDYKKQIKSEKIVLIVDLGGGTSDFTVIRLSGEPFSPEDVLSIGGVSVAGDVLDGDLVSRKVAPQLGSEVEYKFPMGNNILKMPPVLKYQLMSPADIVLLSQKDLLKFLKEVRKCTILEEDSRSLDRLFALIEDNLGFALYEEMDRVKRALCSNGYARLHFLEDRVKIEEDVSLEEFETYTQDSIDQIFKTLDEVLLQSQVAAEKVDHICCTGGTSRIPAVRKELLRRFGAEKLNDLNSFQSVIAGLSQRAIEI